MDVDGTAAQPPAQIVGEDLHVAGEHHQLRARRLDELHELSLLVRLGLGGHGHQEIRDLVLLGDAPHVRMIGNYGADFHAQFPDAVPVQQIFQAMVELGDHDHDAAAVCAVVNGPVHLLGVGGAHEILAQPRDVDRIAAHPAKRDAHEESPGQHVVELVHLHDVEPMAGEKTRYPGGRAHAAGAAGGQDVRVGGVEVHPRMVPGGGRALIVRRGAHAQIRGVSEFLDGTPRGGEPSLDYHGLPIAWRSGVC